MYIHVAIYTNTERINGNQTVPLIVKSTKGQGKNVTTAKTNKYKKQTIPLIVKQLAKKRNNMIEADNKMDNSQRHQHIRTK